MKLSESRDMSAPQEMDKKIELLMKEIRKEDVPERLLQLAHQLQAAIDAREESSR